MTRTTRFARSLSPWRLLLGVLCIGLVLLAGTISVAHSHPDAVSHTDCAQCVTAHATIQVAAIVLQLLVAHLVIWVAATSVPARIPTSLFRFALFTRPPPAAAYLS